MHIRGSRAVAATSAITKRSHRAAPARTVPNTPLPNEATAPAPTAPSAPLQNEATEPPHAPAVRSAICNLSSDFPDPLHTPIACVASGGSSSSGHQAITRPASAGGVGTPSQAAQVAAA